MSQEFSSARLQVQQLFKKHFGFTPTHLAKAPGRLELLGNHTDYNQGLVMSLAVDKYILISSAPRIDGKIELVSSAFPQVEKFSLSEFKKNPEAPWADYVKGVLQQLRKKNIHFSGFSAAIHGSIPMGAGMSSSAALEVATAMTIRQLHPFVLRSVVSEMPPKRNHRGLLPALSVEEKLALAKVCQAAENQFVGVNCGLLDQISSLFGKAFHVIQIDCKHESVELTPMIGNFAVVVCNSGVKHQLVGGEYNELRQHCEEAAKALGAKSLRSVDVPYLNANKSRLTERQYQCAYHVVGEIQRVIFGERALRSDDFEQFGQYMFQSHDSSRDFFKNSTPELDLLVELARAQPSCLGARLTGGGFGGATINLVHRPMVDDFMKTMALQYQARSGIQMKPMVCNVVDGAE